MKYYLAHPKVLIHVSWIKKAHQIKKKTIKKA